VKDVVLLRKNQRQAADPTFASLLGRVGSGEAIPQSRRNSCYSDYSILSDRLLRRLRTLDTSLASVFEEAPVIVGLRKIRDPVNNAKLHRAASKIGVRPEEYHALDKLRGEPLHEDVQQRLWRVRSTVPKDTLGIIPLFCGMKVMIMENLALSNKLVNGAEGVVKHVTYTIDDAGQRSVEISSKQWD
jgi:hypothetical protein